MPQRLNSFFTGSPELRDLTHRAKRLAAAQRAYCAAIPPMLASASRVIGLEQRVLTVGADNGAIAAKLRQSAPHVLHRLQGDGMEVTGILVKVQVSHPPLARVQQAPTLNDVGRRQLAELAATLRDSPLKNALQRLINPH